MPIRFKVVGPDRKSSSFHTFPKTGEKLVKTYKKGRTVKAIKDSPGILTFNIRKNAKAFIYDYNQYGLKIIKVQGIGKGNRKVRLLRITEIPGFWTLEAMFKAFVKKDLRYTIFPEIVQTKFKGTIAYKSVKVLE